MYQKRNNFQVAPPNSSNGTAGVSSTSELISETAKSMTQKQSVLLELESKSKISYAPAEREKQFKKSKIFSEKKVKVHKS